MKVVAFNGSARKDGNTAFLIKQVFKELEREGIDCEMIQLSGKKMHGCFACYKCFEHSDKYCSVKNDYVNDCIDRMIDAEGILLASPTYFSNVSTEIKALIDRAGLVAIANNYMFQRKVGASIVAVRRAGALHVFNSLNHFFFINQMIVPGSSYWNLGIGQQIGDVEKDTEGMNTMEILGKNLAWLLKKIHD